MGDKMVTQYGTVTDIQCLSCAHVAPDLQTCKAFPGGIPSAIKAGDADHRHPFPGDGGVLYEAKEPKTDPVAVT